MNVPELVAYAIRTLETAVHDLVGMRYTRIRQDNGAVSVHTRDSRYQEIVNTIAGQQGTQLGGHSRSMPPIWIDGTDWLRLVDSTVRKWVPTPGSTPSRLYYLAEYTWTPEDAHQVNGYTTHLQEWIRKADLLLEPEGHEWELVTPCPYCGVKTVYREDSAGEHVRQAALQMTALGCRCLNCDARWTPEHYQQLAKDLGCELPPGVLE